MLQINVDEIKNIQDKEEIINKVINWTSLEILLDYNSNFVITKTLRDIISDMADIMEVDPKWKNRLVLICDEIHNNAIEYWSVDGDRGQTRVIINKEKDQIYINIEVEDSGKWKAHKTKKEMLKLQKEKLEKWFINYKSTRWRWLFMIIYKLVDELYFEDSPRWGLIVGIKKRLPYSS